MMGEDGVSWEGFTIDDWLEEFEQSTAKTRREAKKVMLQGAKDIMATSKDYCPVDEHNLEEAHELAQVTMNQENSEVDIRVGGVVGGRDVDEYAMIMHEGLAPFGSGFAGTVKPIRSDGQISQSYIKDRGRGVVGGKFLERAADEHEQKIIEKVQATLPGE